MGNKCPGCLNDETTKDKEIETAFKNPKPIENAVSAARICYLQAVMKAYISKKYIRSQQYAVSKRPVERVSSRNDVRLLEGEIPDFTNDAVKKVLANIPEF